LTLRRLDEGLEVLGGARPVVRGAEGHDGDMDWL